MSDQRTHFSIDCVTTLCGSSVTSIILTDHPATCTVCHDAHARKGWTFPLPTTVAGVTP